MYLEMDYDSLDVGGFGYRRIDEFAAFSLCYDPVIVHQRCLRRWHLGMVVERVTTSARQS